MQIDHMTTRQAVEYLKETGGDIISNDGALYASYETEKTILVKVLDRKDIIPTTYSPADFERREMFRTWAAEPLTHYDHFDGVLPEAEAERRADEA